MAKKIMAVLFLLFTGICWAVEECKDDGAGIERVKVVDGDSLEKGALRIRILNIDAPEYKQFCYDTENRKYLCGQKATEYMRKLVENGVSCKYLDTDRYGRLLSQCYQKDGTDIGRQMVLDGWAIAYGDAYRSEEAEAKKNKKGIWQGRFMRPELFRAMKKAVKREENKKM